MKKGIFSGVLTTLLCVPLWGQQANTPDLAAQNAALEQKVRDLEDRLVALEGKVRILQSAQAPPAQRPTTEAQPAASAEAPAPAQPQAPVVPTGTSPIQGQSQVASTGRQLPNYGGASSCGEGAESRRQRDRRLHWRSRKRNGATFGNPATLPLIANA